jgi:restriction endonuclease S subunit
VYEIRAFSSSNSMFDILAPLIDVGHFFAASVYILRLSLLLFAMTFTNFSIRKFEKKNQLNELKIKFFFLRNELKIKLLTFYLMSKVVDYLLENLKKNQLNELKIKLLPFYLMSKVVDIAEGSSNTNVFEIPSSSNKLKYLLHVKIEAHNKG